MDRVFAVVNPRNGNAVPAEAAAIVEIEEPFTPQAATAEQNPAVQPEGGATIQPFHRRWWLLLAGLCLLSGTAALTAVLLWRGWMQARYDLQQERQLQLLQRLQPSPAPLPTAEIAEPVQVKALPPLRVELPPVIPPAAPVDPATETPPSVVPELMGVVKVPGRSGSAIFTSASGSLSTAEGEPIGSSGWILEKVKTDQVVIRRGTDTLQLSLGR